MEDAVVRPKTFGLLLAFEMARRQRLHPMSVAGPVWSEPENALATPIQAARA